MLTFISIFILATSPNNKNGFLQIIKLKIINGEWHFLIYKTQVDIQYAERSHRELSIFFFRLQLVIQVFLVYYVPGTMLGLKVAIKMKEQTCPWVSYLLIGRWKWVGWQETLLTKILKWKACSQMIIEVWTIQCGSTEKSNWLSRRLHREGAFESYLERWVEKFTKRRDEESNTCLKPIILTRLTVSSMQVGTGSCSMLYSWHPAQHLEHIKVIFDRLTEQYLRLRELHVQ